VPISGFNYNGIAHSGWLRAIPEVKRYVILSDSVVLTLLC